MGFSRDELAKLVAAVAERDEVALLELNFSCPNVETGLIMGADPGETARSVERLRPLTEKPLIVKLTPNATDPAAVAVAAQEAGADAVSLINTLKGMALDPRGSGRPWLGAGTGGYPGRRSARSPSSRSRASLRRCGAGRRHGRHRVRSRRRGFPARGRIRRRRRDRELPRPGCRQPHRAELRASFSRERDFFPPRRVSARGR